MAVKTITNGKLTIKLSKYLDCQKTQILETFDNIDEEALKAMTNKKNKVITKTEFEDAVNRLYNLALDIIDEKLGINIWDYLPYTKAGLFHKTSSILLATSNIKDVWNQDYFSMNILDLRLTPCSGDGTVAYINLEWHSRQKKEEPIFDEMNIPKKVEKKRNKYLKLKDLKPGYTYFDAKGNEFLYVGQLYTDDRHLILDEIYTNKEDYLKSKKRKETLEKRKGYEANKYIKYNGQFFYLKMTKKNETFINTSTNIGELIGKSFDIAFWNWDHQFKTLYKPMQFVSEGSKLLDSDLGEGFYYGEQIDARDGSIKKYFFYVEETE